ncbi:ribosome maturation factor RimM [Alkalibacillus almallahensis]|uniref:ribosome maturation factor RimM n=1 Tax=Alkalibacillus almallahensis TaxID=1379154 RepID=UPI00141ECC9F|nr:ribosome maturation factor RimM [Alkalibacillus almallahensis]NIK10766.1 16S rRNA processing protein RimM [Alkalibacillus almallahensis]
MDQDYLKVGTIVNTHGVQGEVRVMSVTDFNERYETGNRLFMNWNNQMVEIIVQSHRAHKQFDLLTFEGYDTMESVEPLKQTTLYVSAEDLHELDEDEFYYFEIIGCDVYFTTGEHLGRIKEVMQPGANDVWVVDRPEPGAKDALIPFIDDIVKDIDIENGLITIEYMEGLLP